MALDQDTIAKIAEHYKAIISLIGENPDREGLAKTPIRAARALAHAVSGYSTDPADIVRQAIFSHSGSGMIIVRDIEFYSLCEHHLLPFFGHISVGYIPDGSIVGLSKVARVVDACARRLQVQENLTAQVCRALYEALPAKGVMASCSAGHLCMKMRGVEKQDSTTTTTEAIGCFTTDAGLRAEFLAAIRN